MICIATATVTYNMDNNAASVSSAPPANGVGQDYIGTLLVCWMFGALSLSWLLCSIAYYSVLYSVTAVIFTVLVYIEFLRLPDVDARSMWRFTVYVCIAGAISYNDVDDVTYRHSIASACM